METVEEKKAILEESAKGLSNKKEEIRRLTKGEIAQVAFDALFEKHGGKGFASAVKAVEELYPHYTAKRMIFAKARYYLSKSKLVVDLLTVLEAKGVDAHKAAERIRDLLDAKVKTTYIRHGEDTEITEEIDVSAIDKGLTHALKAGVGGGYAPEKSLVGIKDFNLSKLLDQLDKEDKRAIPRNSEPS